MNLFWIFVLFVVLLGFALLTMYIPHQDSIPYNNDVQQLITTFTKSGEYIGFDMDVAPPITKYVYDAQKNIAGKILDNGTISPVTEEEVKELSTLDVNVQDRQQGQSKICKMGYQCDITGVINLIDPSTGDRIPPPYSYSLTIDCDYRDFCALSPSISQKPTLTFDDGTFKYTFVITEKIPIGQYQVTVYVTSYYTNEEGEQARRFATRLIEVVN